MFWCSHVTVNNTYYFKNSYNISNLSNNISSSRFDVYFSTALLMIKFYDNLQTVTQNVPLALNSAQQWFRRVTQRELLQWLDGKTDMNAEQKQKVKKILGQEYQPEQRPFKQPFSWAAFCAIGE